MTDTPIIIDTRKVRAAISRQFGNDVEKYITFLRSSNQRGKPLVRVLPAIECPARSRKLGTLTGEATAKGDIVHAGFEHEWECIK